MKVECKNSDYKKQRKLGSRFDNYNQFLKWTIFDKSYSRVIDTLINWYPEWNISGWLWYNTWNDIILSIYQNNNI